MKKIRTQEKMERALENMLSEHLRCALLVGYDVDGNEVVCRLMDCDQDRDSLLLAVSTLAEKLNDAYYGEEVRSQVEDDD